MNKINISQQFIQLEQVTTLGTGIVNIVKIRLKQQATKAMYFVLAKTKDRHLSIERKFKLFDSMVLPILLYGCEIWGYENNDIYNSVQINFS